jgi:hypothetical protein
MKDKIGVPSKSGMKKAFTDYAIGAGGGLAYGLGQGLFGNGLIGTLAGPLLAGSIVKGSRGEILATMAGFMLTANMLNQPNQVETSSASATM